MVRIFQIAKKKTEGRGHDHDHALKQEMRELENNAERDGRVDSKSGHDDLREFARRQAADNPAKAGLGGNSSSIMAWGIVEGLTEKVGRGTFSGDRSCAPALCLSAGPLLRRGGCRCIYIPSRKHRHTLIWYTSTIDTYILGIKITNASTVA